MAKEKKALTPQEEEKKFKRIAKLCNLGQFASLITPFVAIGFANFGDYFVQYDGWKITVAGILAAFMMGITVFTVVNKKVQNSYGPLIIKLALLTAILFLIDKIVSDLKFICLFPYNRSLYKRHRKHRGEPEPGRSHRGFREGLRKPCLRICTSR